MVAGGGSSFTSILHAATAERLQPDFVHVQHWSILARMKTSRCNSINIECTTPPTTGPSDQDFVCPSPNRPATRTAGIIVLLNVVTADEHPAFSSTKPPDDRARTAEDWRVRYHCHILSHTVSLAVLVILVAPTRPSQVLSVFASKAVNTASSRRSTPPPLASAA